MSELRAGLIGDRNSHCLPTELDQGCAMLVSVRVFYEIVVCTLCRGPLYYIHPSDVIRAPA